VLKKSEQQPARETILPVASGVAVTGVMMLLSALIAWTLFPRGSVAISVFIAISVLTTTFVAGIIGAPAISRASSGPWPKAMTASTPPVVPMIMQAGTT
jgi:hypothetical protein